MRACLLRRPDDLASGIPGSQGDISDTAAEQDAFLLNDPDLMNATRRGNITRSTLSISTAAGRHMQPLNQFGERALA
jgi:hypothetical protein